MFKKDSGRTIIVKMAGPELRRLELNGRALYLDSLDAHPGNAQYAKAKLFGYAGAQIDDAAWGTNGPWSMARTMIRWLFSRWVTHTSA